MGGGRRRTGDAAEVVGATEDGGHDGGGPHQRLLGRKGRRPPEKRNPLFQQRYSIESRPYLGGETVW